MTVSFYTLGCKVNQNETGALARLFRENGFVPVADGAQADVYVVNSCTVTAGGDKKSRQWLRRAKRDNPDALTQLQDALARKHGFKPTFHRLYLYGICPDCQRNR